MERARRADHPRSKPTKIRATGDIPAHFTPDFCGEYNREHNVLDSEGMGESSLMLAISLFETMRDPAAFALPGNQVQLDAPATAENVLRALGAMPGFL